MVNAREATESAYISAQLVKDSPTKILVILGEGEYEKTDYGNKLTIPVEIDKKKKMWRVNKESGLNLLDGYGEDTQSWLGKKVQLKVKNILGKESVIGDSMDPVEVKPVKKQ